ncbi:hypothetical protein SAMN05428987_3131 [Paenibacillus sp. CF095]|nr:hypothetical protein SAMN05428987_3131 [Paenibacillus sp. CF095]
MQLTVNNTQTTSNNIKTRKYGRRFIQLLRALYAILIITKEIVA